jgi:hypothetical protein
LPLNYAIIFLSLSQDYNLRIYNCSLGLEYILNLEESFFYHFGADLTPHRGFIPPNNKFILISPLYETEVQYYSFQMDHTCNKNYFLCNIPRLTFPHMEFWYKYCFDIYTHENNRVDFSFDSQTIHAVVTDLSNKQIIDAEFLTGNQLYFFMPVQSIYLISINEQSTISGLPFVDLITI